MPSSRKSALVISQNLRSVDDILVHLQEMGFDVYHNRSGSEALKFARKNKLDLMVLDISLNTRFDSSVLERVLTLLELKSDEHLSKIPLVVTSQETFQENFGVIFSEINFLTKPININSMIDKIKELVPNGVSSILIVDDEESARDIMRAAAKKAGWKSVEAVNGRDALEKVQAHIPSIILLDLMMPEMDGFTFITELQKHEAWRQIPIIIVSAKELSSDERILLQQHTKNILQKGAYTRQELIDAIYQQVE
ncbi:MAG TPA: response regulator [Gammaproteobacteria bacterium]|nr:response regulator [Gammaproteobacteria bacterium]